MTMHYHGTPITPITALYELTGRNFCVSHAAPQDVARCHQIGQSVMLDNGAFSTQAMRDRIRELMTDPMDDYDRAVACVVSDLEALLGAPRCEVQSEEVRKLLGEFYQTVDVMVSAHNSEQNRMCVWARDVKAVQDVMLFLERLRDIPTSAQEGPERGALTRIAAECHRAKWEFDMNDEDPPKAAAVRVLVDKAFATLHRIGDLALKLRDGSAPSSAARDPGWIDQNHQIDRYGVALMMIREGCADPAGLARRILSEFEASPVPSAHQNTPKE